MVGPTRKFHSPASPPHLSSSFTYTLDPLSVSSPTSSAPCCTPTHGQSEAVPGLHGHWGAGDREEKGERRRASLRARRRDSQDADTDPGGGWPMRNGARRGAAPGAPSALVGGAEGASGGEGARRRGPAAQKGERRLQGAAASAPAGGGGEPGDRRRRGVSWGRRGQEGVSGENPLDSRLSESGDAVGKIRMHVVPRILRDAAARIIEK